VTTAGKLVIFKPENINTSLYARHPEVYQNSGLLLYFFLTLIFYKVVIKVRTHLPCNEIYYNRVIAKSSRE